MLEHRHGKDQRCAVHQVMTLGNRTLLDILLRDFDADVELRTNNKLSVMHLAAQTYAGYIAIFILQKEFDYEVSPRDNYQATPLHFAVLKQEFMNV